MMKIQRMGKIGKTVFSLLLIFTVVLGLLPANAISIKADTIVLWQDIKDTLKIPNGVTLPTVSDTSQINKMTDSLVKMKGWYFVEGEVTNTNRINLIGDTNIVLMDGARLYVKGFLGTTKNLTIWSQSKGTGKMTVSSGDDDAFAVKDYRQCGGDIEISGNASCISAHGNVYIYGGSLLAETTSSARSNIWMNPTAQLKLYNLSIVRAGKSSSDKRIVTVLGMENYYSTLVDKNNKYINIICQQYANRWNKLPATTKAINALRGVSVYEAYDYARVMLDKKHQSEYVLVIYEIYSFPNDYSCIQLGWEESIKDYKLQTCTAAPLSELVERGNAENYSIYVIGDVSDSAYDGRKEQTACFNFFEDDFLDNNKISDTEVNATIDDVTINAKSDKFIFSGGMYINTKEGELTISVPAYRKIKSIDFYLIPEFSFSGLNFYGISNEYNREHSKQKSIAAQSWLLTADNESVSVEADLVKDVEHYTANYDSNIKEFKITASGSKNVLYLSKIIVKYECLHGSYTSVDATKHKCSHCNCEQAHDMSRLVSDRVEPTADEDGKEKVIGCSKCNYTEGGAIIPENITKEKTPAAGGEAGNEDKKDTTGPISKDTISTSVQDAAGNSYEIIASANNQVEFKGASDPNTKSIKLPASILVDGVSYKVVAISDNAFKNNKKLTKIVLPNSITKIGKNAFRGCTSLGSITIPKNVVSIGDNAFYGCKKLNSITITTTKLKAKNVGKNIFKGLPKKATMKTPKKLTKTYRKLFKSSFKGTYK